MGILKSVYCEGGQKYVYIKCYNLYKFACQKHFNSQNDNVLKMDNETSHVHIIFMSHVGVH